MNPKNLGQNIKNFRISKELTQQEFADLLTIAPQTVSKWERGASYPDIFYLYKISKILDVSILDLLKGDEDADGGDYYIAIDGGGTKTEFVLFKSSGEVVSSVVFGASNPNSCGVEKTFSILKKGIDYIFSLRKTPKRIFAGIAGSSVGNHREVIHSFLKKTYPSCQINVDSDIKNIIGLTRENKKCIAAIIGTGSVVYGWDGVDLKRVGGWGYLFGDEGSGYDIGREVLIEAYAYGDGLTPLSEVARLVEERLGSPVVNHASKLYSEGRSYIASFSSIAFEAMAMGDKVAEEIISKSAARFARLINHVHKLGEYGDRVIISGGLAMHDETMNRMIEKEIDHGIVVEIPDRPPIFGAMRTCLELDGVKIDFDALKVGFDESYKKK